MDTKVNLTSLSFTFHSDTAKCSALTFPLAQNTKLPEST